MIRGTMRTKRPTTNVNLNASIHNRFDVEVVDAESGEIKQKAVGYNCICSNLWTQLFNKATYFNYVQYGSGSGTPASTDTALFTYNGYGGLSYKSRSYDPITGVFSMTKAYQMTASTAVGVTLTEVGIASSTSQSSLCTHAMLKDMNGNLLTITKTATDVINIYATIYVHITLPEGLSMVCTHQNNIEGDMFYAFCGHSVQYPSYYVPVHGFAVNDWNYYLTPSSFSWSYRSNFSGVSVSTDSTNKQIKITATRLEADKFNLNGLTGLYFCSLSANISNDYGATYFCLIPGRGTWLPYTQVTDEAIGTGDGATTEFATAFSYPYNASVSVDGSATSCTVSAVPNSKITTPLYFMEVIENGSISDKVVNRMTTQSGGSEKTYFNHAYSAGIATITMGTAGKTLKCSNDLKTWTSIATSTSTSVTIPDSYANYKYWYVESGGISAITLKNTSRKAIAFASAPADGSVITASYRTPDIGKDENHVFDLYVTFTFSEYTEG